MKEYLHEPVFSSPEDFPAKASWQRGRPKALRHLSWHAEWEFHLVKRGKGAYFIRDRHYPFSGGFLIIVASREVHRFIPQDDSFIEKGSLYLDARFVTEALMGETFKLPGSRCVRLNDSESTAMEFLIERIREEKERKDRFWREILRAETSVFLLLVKRFCARPAPAPEENPLGRELVGYIETRFASDLTLAQLAADFSRSAATLSQAFKKHTGISPKQYMLQRRIIEAKKLLEEEPELKVYAIARRVGFSDFALFNRSFKRIAGLTPSAYRKISHHTERNYYLPEKNARVS